MAGRGGPRPGAGRKPRAERYAEPIATAEDLIAGRLAELVDNQFTLALGGGERVEEEYAAAGTVFTDDYETDEFGRSRKVRRPVFADRPADELVLVKRKRITLGPDARANEYLIDRILGKPTQSVEAEVSGPGGEAIPVVILAALQKVYGDDSAGDDGAAPA